MRKKVFLFPGFVEDRRVFARMEEFLMADFELVHVDYLPVLAEMEQEYADISWFCGRLRELYDIKKEDLLVGHSFGGWVCANVQTITGSPVVSIASFTNPKKPVHGFIGFNRLGFGLVRFGAFKWRLFHRIALWKYRNTPQLPVIQVGLDIMNTWQDRDLLKITRLIAFQRVVSPVAPLLRFHADRDEIVYPPDEPHFCVPNATHAIHYTHAQWISGVILQWVKAEYPAF